MSTKRSKLTAAIPMNESSDSETSDATPTTKNKPTNLTTTFHSYCSLQITTPPAKKTVEVYRKQLRLFYQELLEIDPEAKIVTYKMTPTMNNNTKTYKTKLYNVIQSPLDIPKSITQMSKFFAGGKPNSKGGKVYTNIHFMHEESLENILFDLKEALLDQEASIFTKTIKHWDSVVIGWLHLFHHQIDTSTWQS